MTRFWAICHECQFASMTRRHGGIKIDADVKPNVVICAKHNRRMEIRMEAP